MQAKIMFCEKNTEPWSYEFYCLAGFPFLVMHNATSVSQYAFYVLKFRTCSFIGRL